MSFFKSLLYLFYPKVCAVCKDQLLENEDTICIICRHDLPIIFSKNTRNNKITSVFKGRIFIEQANTLLAYTKEGKTKKLIHHLKYKGNQNIGNFIGKWFGELLIENNQFSTIDYIIPVPLHPVKERKRGYNQVTTFAKTISSYLKKPLIIKNLTKTHLSTTQTFKQRFERFNDLETKFSINNPSFFNGKHVLLIDDVITTGATIEACCKELLKSEKIKISILTIAYTT